jgi:hypothetical protein
MHNCFQEYNFLLATLTFQLTKLKNISFEIE